MARTYPDDDKRLWFGKVVVGMADLISVGQSALEQVHQTTEKTVRDGEVLH